MGGGSYDRDDYSYSSTKGWSGGSSKNARDYVESKLKATSLERSMLPNGKVLKSTSKHPIIIMLDVTGSNIEFAKIIYEKMPMFYGQIEQQGYLEDFEIAFCAVGDAYTDYYPLQIASFAKGTEIDSWLQKLVLEGNGGGQKKESYELGAYYIYKNAEFSVISEPIIFFIGDEAPYEEVNKSQAEEFDIECRETCKEPFKLLREKVSDNVFMFLNPYCGTSFDSIITESWRKVLAPEHVIKIREEKSIVDLMLGVIAMLGNKTLKSYEVDMLEREQTKNRVKNVKDSLKAFACTRDNI